jgi:polar amino acid transport system ATP-binding protein
VIELLKDDHPGCGRDVMDVARLAFPADTFDLVVLFFDEPTSALGPELVGEVLRVMNDLACDGMTLLVVTHEIAFAREVADRIVFMADAGIVEEGMVEQVTGALREPRTRQFFQRVLS